MTNQEDVIQFAIQYLLSSRSKTDIDPDARYVLHRQLQYWLCTSFSRHQACFGEMTRQNVAALCDAWIISRAAANRLKQNGETRLDTEGVYRDGEVIRD